MTQDWYAAGLDHVWQPYTQMKTARPPLAVAATRGCRIVLSDGRELIDGIASWWTACHGYNHPVIIEAVERQLRVMPHVMIGGIAHEPASTLARRLATMLSGDLTRVFLCESGSVAVEVALKMALQHWQNRGEVRRKRFLSFRGAYHGDTSGAMAVSDPDEGIHASFVGVSTRQLIAPLPCDDTSCAAFDALIDRNGEALAGIIIEPLVQGAGGMLFHDADTLRRVRAAADRCGALLIADEVFTGFGRLGAMFACAAAQVAPDIICLAKALTGGVLPLAATVARQSVFEAFWDDDPAKALMHGPTFMGHALACAAANASLDLFEREPRLAQVANIADQLVTELEPCRGLTGVRDVRVRGAIGVVDMESIDDVAALRARFIDEGVFIRPFGRTIYLTPAFTITSDEISQLTAAICKVVRQGV